jgi:hypothetical protein
MGLTVDWVAPDPAALGIRLAERLRLPRPDPDEDRFALVLAGGALRIATVRPGGRERLVGVARADDLDGVMPAAGHAGLLGVGWATVDSERACRELTDRFRLERQAFARADDDGWLGATARTARVGASHLVVLEPVTEGRAAAALARFGEGPVAVYLGLPGPSSGVVRDGPLGAESLLERTPAWGPFALVVAAAAARSDRSDDDRAGTIDR